MSTASDPQPAPVHFTAPVRLHINVQLPSGQRRAYLAGGGTLLARRSLIHEEPLGPAAAFLGRRGEDDPFGDIDSAAFVMLGPGPEAETARRRFGEDLGEGPSGAAARCTRADGTRFVADIGPALRLT